MKPQPVCCFLLFLATEAATSFSSSSLAGPSGIYHRQYHTTRRRSSSRSCENIASSSAPVEKNPLAHSIARITGKRYFKSGDSTRWGSREAEKGGEKVSTPFGGFVKKLTGKDKYEFGDLTRHTQKKLGKQVNKLTGKEEYEFGDLTKWLDLQARKKTKDSLLFLNHDHRPHDDSSVEQATTPKQPFSLAARRFLQAIIVLAIRFVIKFGKERQVLRILPTGLLIQILQLCIDRHELPKLIRVVSTELDERVKYALTGDKKYRFGDLTRRKLFEFTGKRSYQFGDVTRTILERAASGEKDRYRQQAKQELDILEKDVGGMKKEARMPFFGWKRQ